MSVRAAWLALLGLGCAPVPIERGDHGEDARQLVEVAIEFEPPLAATGTARIEHESGWVWSGPAPPSGVVVHMPPGPASLQLTIGADTHESAVVVPFATEQWSWRVAR